MNRAEEGDLAGDAQKLSAAIESFDVELVGVILARSPAVANEHTGDDGEDRQTMISLAIRGGRGSEVSEAQLAVVGALVEAGAGLAEKHTAAEGMYPLGVAAWLGKLAIVELLIEAGADLDAEPEPSDTALSVAADHRHAAVVERLIEAGASYGARPLAQAGLVERLGNLLDRDPEAANRVVHLGHLNGVYGPPLLALVEDYGFEDPHLPAVARLLIERGADVNTPDSDGRTALQQVLAKRQSCAGNGVETRYCDEVIELLIDAGAEIDLFAAIGLGDANLVGRLLAETPALATRPRTDGTTPAQFAQRFDRPEIIVLLAPQA